ncbi:hypothetical protein ANAPRD1_00071 [Anaplasma phagocytophilum]|nr:hypothetical protein ANAPRD1_00071 [Anaplasma phagocytophilum]SCV62516.1 hypothetical protein ANAPH2_00332 [Anaplasma phagocytophilum]
MFYVLQLLSKRADCFHAALYKFLRGILSFLTILSMSQDQMNVM